MYIAIVILLMVVCPALSVAIEVSASHHAVNLVFLVGKWFVFWAVGIRMLTAGIRQTLQPQFTAGEIFGIRNPEAHGIVREVGFGNLAMGTLGICSLFRPAWIVPAALVGGLYYGLAGLGHIFRSDKNAIEQTALFSDAFAFLVLLVFVVRSLA